MDQDSGTLQPTMEKIKWKRAPLRAKVTRTGKEVDLELAKNPVDLVKLRVCFDRLSKLEPELSELDGQIMDLMFDANCNEDEREAEALGADQYQDEIVMTKIKMNAALIPPRPPSPAPSSAGYDSANQSGQSTHYALKRNFKLPKIELKKFNGDLKEWLGFWAQFKKIHEDDTLHVTDKFQYLLQAMTKGTEARDLVESYPQTSENYQEAIDALHQRYGRESLLLQVYIRELLKLVIANVNQKEKLSLDKMYLKLKSHLGALKTLNLADADPATWLFPLVESSLPVETLQAWQRSPLSTKDGKLENPPRSSLDYLMDFIEAEVRGQQQIALAQSGFQETSKEEKAKGQQGKNKKSKEDDSVATAASLYSGEKKANLCIFCEKPGHKSHKCYKADKLSFEERRAKVKESRACFQCLEVGHRAKDCKVKVECASCFDTTHWKIMCHEKKKDGVGAVTEGVRTMLVSQPSLAMKTSTEGSISLRGTMKVKVLDSKNNGSYARVLIDPGSDISYITETLVGRLKLKSTREKTFQTEVFGGSWEIFSRKEYQVELRGMVTGSEKITLYSERQICGECDPIPYGPWVKELMRMNVVLSDITEDPGEIDILIGTDWLGQIQTGKMVKVCPTITATETTLGWYVTGRTPAQKSQTMAARTISLMTKTQELTALWELDALGIKDNPEKVSQEEHDKSVKKNFHETLRQAEDGRYVVKLPWICSDIRLPHNKEVAVKRLQSATQKLIGKDQYESYDSVFRAWEKEGIINEKVVEEEPTSGHFLPHRPVFKPESLTTPVRPVFDASCRIRNNLSLNQCLEKGPNMLELILSIILRFRKEKVGAISDIRKAFQMIEVDPEDRKFQRFLWWEDPGRIMKVYEHCRVVFGLNCSPFVLAAVLEFHLRHVPEEEKKISAELFRSLYVDNCVTSFSTIDEYHEFKEKSTAILSRAKMDLRQWESNTDEEMEETVTSVLGYKWDKIGDFLICDVPKWDVDAKVTKRSVLSLASQVFDPIGYTAPAVLQLKMLLQEAWAGELKWDEVWKEKEKESVKKWSDQMQSLGKIQIPRCVTGSKEEISLHVFTDASKDAYAGVVFLRCREGERISIQLLLAKARVAPLQKDPENLGKVKNRTKRMTIPRLELMGCYVGAKLADTVRKSIEFDKIPTIFWSDSTTALAWIERKADWGTFVENRVKQIRDLTNKDLWRHVPGKMNPADLPSRGCSPEELLQSKWWEGPEWLAQPEDTWPNSEQTPDEAEVRQEMKKGGVYVKTGLSTSEPATSQPKFLSYYKNVRITAYAIRIMKKEKVEDLKRTLSIQELRQAELIMLKVIQKKYFPSGAPIKERIEMRDGLLKIKSKLEYKEDSEDFRYPILLPNNCPIVEELIREVHRMYAHGGVQFTLNKLRERFWIPRGRKTVTRALRKCVTCRRQDAKPLQVNPIALPTKRVTPGEVFTTTGVDLAGPFHLKNKCKVWVVLYTCAVYRCVVLDIVDSLSTESFINCLERFIWNYGRPDTIYSDNGTNFVGTENLMKKLDWPKIEEAFQVKKIQWTFNPPTAAWWGGWWERLIKSTKGLLKRMLGRAYLTRDELATCLSAVAATINERPLTSLTEDEGDLIPLSPAMFLKGTKMARFPEVEKVTGKELQLRYKCVKKLQRDLQDRFRKEYLAGLVQRASEKKTEDPKVGDIVLVGADTKKRFEWPLGRIMKLFYGKDGEPRSVEVKTSRGVLRRPMQRLYPLEIPHGDPQFPKPVPESSLPEPVDEDEMADEDIITTPESHAEPEVVTRSGRAVKKPRRYGAFFSAVQ